MRLVVVRFYVSAALSSGLKAKEVILHTILLGVGGSFCAWLQLSCLRSASTAL